MVSEDSLRECYEVVAAGMQAAQCERNPFPHAHINNFLPLRVYEQLISCLPPDDSYVRSDNLDPVAGWKYKDRLLWHPNPISIAMLPNRCASFWHDILPFLKSERFQSSLVSIYGSQVEMRLQRIRETTGVALTPYVDIFLSRDLPGYEIGPHTDTPRKIVTLILYLPRAAAQRGQGTTIYRPRDRTFTCSGAVHHRRDEFECSHVVPFLANSAFSFLKTTQSFHGVERGDPSQPPRDCLHYSLMTDTTEFGEWDLEIR